MSGLFRERLTPAIGMKAAISPNASIVKKTMTPTMKYDITMEAGPPVDRDFPVPKRLSGILTT
jgi:hypothetical protein